MKTSRLSWLLSLLLLLKLLLLLLLPLLLLLLPTTRTAQAKLAREPLLPSCTTCSPPLVSVKRISEVPV